MDIGGNGGNAAGWDGVKTYAEALQKTGSDANVVRIGGVSLGRPAIFGTCFA